MKLSSRKLTLPFFIMINNVLLSKSEKPKKKNYPTNLRNNDIHFEVKLFINYIKKAINLQEKHILC